jgi:hypothetical protein
MSWAPAPPPRRRLWPPVVVSVVAVLGLAAAGFVVVGSAEPAHPDEWDERVAPLADYVERERGLSFDHPVTVEFLSDEEYSAAARSDEGELSEDDRASIEESGAVYEALALVPAGTDLVQTTNDMADSGTLAFYDPETERVTVRGTEMSTGLAVTLVHELVHVAQDQAFDLERPRPGHTSGASEGFDALVEGDATRVEVAYIETLSLEEQDAYWDEYDAEYEESQDQLAEVPGALQALFGAPYALGQPMVELIVEDGGNAAVDAAFDEPPTSSEHLFDPRSYFADDAPADVDGGDLPDGAEQIGLRDELGATALFLMLADRIDPLVALEAADGWGGDTYVGYRLGERVCVRVDLVGDSQADTDELAAAFDDWSSAVQGATVAVDDETIALDRCSDAAGETADAADPAPGGAYEALALPATRAQLMARSAAEGRPHDEAFRVGDCFVRRVPLATIVDASAAEELPEEVLDALLLCGAP